MPSTRSPSTVPQAKRTKADDTNVAIDAFRRILRELRRAARKTELATGLSAAQTFVLNTVNRSPGCSLNDVAAQTLTDRTSVAAIVDRLLEDRYITRTQSEQDRRRVSLTITARGQRAIANAAPPPTMMLVEALKALPAVQRAALANGLAALTDQMGLAHEPAGMLFEDTGVGGAKKKRR